MPSYKIITLGCRVNHYESLQVEELLHELGYHPATGPDADVVIVNTCSVTTAAAAKSRNLLRRYARPDRLGGDHQTIAMGCWTTSDPLTSAAISEKVVVVGHGDNVAGRLRAALGRQSPACGDEGTTLPGTISLPQLASRQSLYQRALLKVQDGCDAHCTYCIIPKLRPVLWSRPPEEVVAEARRMVAGGHRELVLTGVFLGAYGQQTALHRRQSRPGGALADLVVTLCREVPDLLRIRLSSLEPGDVTPEFISEIAAHPQVMPHFHLPLQSGSDELLRKMNRQYSSGDYRRMVEQLKGSFDRPAFTTDIIVGFPGETEAQFQQTLELVRDVGFLHVHAFPFSPREGTAAARWTQQMVQQRVVTERMHRLNALAAETSVAYRQQFVGQTVRVLVEHAASAEVAPQTGGFRCGRCERYFAVHFEAPAEDLTGQAVDLTITRVSAARTMGALAHT